MNRLALSILIERRERRDAARAQRAADPHVRIELRVRPHIADAIEAAAEASGLSLDQYAVRALVPGEATP